MIGNDQEGHQGIMVLTLQDLFKQQRRVSEFEPEAAGCITVLAKDAPPPQTNSLAGAAGGLILLVSPVRLNYFDISPHRSPHDAVMKRQASEVQGRRYSVTVSFLEVSQTCAHPASTIVGPDGESSTNCMLRGRRVLKIGPQ